MDNHRSPSFNRPPPSSSNLHSVRKPPAKPWRKPEQQPPKVYRVDPRGFRGLVQQLTGSPKMINSDGKSLRDTVVPPPPLQFGSVQQGQGFGSEGFLSPSWFAPWNNVPLLSPGTMAALGSG